MTGATTRRGLMGAALAGAAAGGVMPFLLPDHPDAKLLALCAEFEMLQRAANGVWPWRVGRGVTVQGPKHIEDENEQERVAGGFEARTHDLQAQIFGIRSQTIGGMRAKTKCLLLSSPEFRFLADDDYEEDSHNPVGLYFVTANLLASLLQDLNNGEVTRRNCMDAPGTEVES